jgi:hypothetical protein
MGLHKHQENWAMLARCFLLFATCLFVLLPAACVVTVEPVDGGNGGADGGANTITIRIVNATNHTLDPEIYISAQPVSVDQLFAASNKYTTFGVGLLGLLAGSDTDSFTIECSEARVIGTKGGQFGGGADGNDLNDPAGSGLQRVLAQDLIFYCGDRITFTYRKSGGEFITTFDVEP